MTADRDWGGVTVLPSKMVPPLCGPACVPRPRLLERLSAGVAQTPVTLLSGPAGSGKTVLAASWVHAQRERRPVAWLTLDESDDPATFAAYMVEVLAQAGVALPDLERPPPGERLPRPFIGGLAVAVLAQPHPVVLVLDNADSLSDREVLGFLDLLVRHAGRQLRLVLCARADPQLPLHQYRLTDTLTEIRADQLAFTAEETRELLTRLGAPVSREVAQALQARTEGWAVGLRLAAAPLKQGLSPDELIASLARDDGSVAQYMVAEVLKDQPASVRRFLLRISVTADLEPELVDRLAGRVNGRRILSGLARANAFVEPSPGSPGGYRIHPLFREMLHAQLAFDHPDEVARLHRICAGWYAEEGHVREAVGHAVEAGEWSLVASLLIDDYAVAHLLTGASEAWLRAPEGLPDTVRTPEAAVVRAARRLGAEVAAAQDDLAVAATAAEDRSARPALRASAAAVCAVAAAGSDADACQAAAELTGSLLSGLGENHRRARREFTAALAVARSVALLRGDAPDGELLDSLHTALTASRAAGAARLLHRSEGQLALIEALRGHLRRAAALAAESEEVADERGLPRADRSPAAATAAAWARFDSYDQAGARRWLARAEESTGDAGVAALLAVMYSRLLRLRHEFDAAAERLRPHLAEDARLPRWAREPVVEEAVRLQYLRGHAGEGLRLLARLEDGTSRAQQLRALATLLGARELPAATVPRAEPGMPLSLTVQAEVLRACLRAEAGAATEAVTALGRALELAGPEELRWPFFDAPPHVRRLLRTQPQLSRASTWLNPSAVPRELTRRAGPVAAGPVSPAAELSERETEVLRYLAELLSTAEIAAAMFVSVNTVRTHIRSILRKLDVGRRNQAVRRARELGIL